MEFDPPVQQLPCVSLIKTLVSCQTEQNGPLHQEDANANNNEDEDDDGNDDEDEDVVALRKRRGGDVTTRLGIWGSLVF